MELDWLCIDMVINKRTSKTGQNTCHTRFTFVFNWYGNIRETGYFYYEEVGFFTEWFFLQAQKSLSLSTKKVD